MQKRPLKTLERVLSKAGVGSRTEARAWIAEGRVKVNGRVTRDPDQWIDMQHDRVRFDNQPLEARERVYVLVYKPTGYLTTYKDPQGRPTVYDLIADVGTFVSPVGRLDLDTSTVSRRLAGWPADVGAAPVYRERELATPGAAST